MLKVGGENVAALEIEAYFDSHEKVLISQVIGIEDDHLGEVPAVFIEKKPGVKISKDELVDFCIGQISNFKIPRYIVFVNEWPMSSTKVQKFKLKDYFIYCLISTICDVMPLKGFNRKILTIGFTDVTIINLLSCSIKLKRL